MRSSKLVRGLWAVAAVAAGLALAALGLEAARAQAAPADPGGSGPSTWYVDNSPGEGLVGYWKFDEISNTHTLNSAALANQTDLRNGAAITDDVPPAMSVPDFDSLLLDGANDHATISDTAALNVAPEAFSLAVWARRATTGTYDAVYDSGAQTNKWWVFIADGGKGNKFGFGVRDIAEFYSTRAITDTGWHHLAVVKRNQAASNLTFYVDGQASGVVTVTSVLTPSGDKRIGALLAGVVTAHFGGQLDELRLYNRALSSIEILYLASGRGCAANGSSWAAPFEDLQCALDVAGSGDEIWVAGGTYRPGTHRLGGYPLVNGVDVLGGFAGSESLPGQRPAFDPANPLTILSGDAAGNDSPFSPGDQVENICAVLSANTVSAALDRLAVQDGNASCSGAVTIRSGGGLFQAGGTLALSSLVFRENRAEVLGGALLVSGGGAISLDEVAFISNTASLGGGLGQNSGHVTLTASSFVSNIASLGGAVALRPGPGNSSLTAVTTHFTHNRANRGGAVDSDVGAGRLDLLFDRVTFDGNQATLIDGGAVRSAAFLPGEVVETYLQTDFISNVAFDDGGAIANQDTTLMIAGSTFTANRSQTTGGGALSVQGAVTVTETTFLSNTAQTIGGGVAVIGSLAMVNSSLIQNSVIANDLTAFGVLPVGGGALVSGTAAVTNSLFLSNTASVFGSIENVAGGGGLAALGSLAVNGGEFRANTARQGGGLQVNGSAEITGALFQANIAGEGGGVAADGGLSLAGSRLIDNIAYANFIFFFPGRGAGLFLVNGDSAVQVAGNLFLGNQAQASLFTPSSGSAMYLHGQAAHIGENTIAGRVVTGTAVAITGSVQVVNNIITSHTVAIEHIGGTTTEDYNLFFGNTVTGTGAITSGSHSLLANPLFVDPALDNYRLLPGSPALDAGDNTVAPPSLTTDLDGNPRYLDSSAPDTGNGAAPIIDLGAYEAFAVEVLNRLYLPLLMR
jgi:hypothetical protein